MSATEDKILSTFIQHANDSRDLVKAAFDTAQQAHDEILSLGGSSTEALDAKAVTLNVIAKECGNIINWIRHTDLAGVTR